MNRDDHLEWAKNRALEYLPHNPQEAFVSMLSDLGKHPELESHIGIELGMRQMMGLEGWANDVGKIEEWIRGFN